MRKATLGSGQWRPRERAAFEGRVMGGGLGLPFVHGTDSGPPSPRSPVFLRPGGVEMLGTNPLQYLPAIMGRQLIELPVYPDRARTNGLIRLTYTLGNVLR